MSDEPGDAGDGSELQRLLAECIERLAAEGPAAVESVCAAHPDLAVRIRDRLLALQRAGFLPEAPGAAPVFARYRIVRPLGRGAMGVVYLAEDLELGRQVALKTCAVASVDAADARARERFLREARAAARLSHPNVVPVHDAGEEAGVLYLAMEAIDGATLAELLQVLRADGVRAGDLTPSHLAAAFERVRPDPGGAPGPAASAFGRTYVESACRIARDVASALAHVHSHGIVHRDVKPSNVLIDRGGRALLFDLGLAHLVDAPALTQSGEFAGSPYYASPEQIAGRRGAVDERTDVYSLGATLYELLALAVPFPSEDAAALLRAIQFDEPKPLRELSPLVPRDLETIAATALDKDPRQRYPTAAALADDLDRLLELRPIRARPAGALQRLLRAARRKKAAASAVLLLAVVVIGAPIALFLFNRAIAAERDQAERAAEDYRREAEKNREVSGFWEGLVLELDASADASTRAAAAELLRRGAAQVDGERLEQPLSRAVVLETLGRVHVQLGRPADALPLFDQALQLRAATLGEGHVDTAGALYHLACTHFAIGNVESARALTARSALAFASAGEPEHPTAALAELLLGEILLRAGDAAAARAAFERALPRLAGDDRAPGGAARALELLGEALTALGDRAGATEALEASLDARRGAARPDLPAIAAVLRRSADLQQRAGDARGAEELFEEALCLEQKATGERGPGVLLSLAGLVPLLPDPADDRSEAEHARAGAFVLQLARNQRAIGDAGAASSLERALLHLQRGGAAARADFAAARVERAEARLAEDELEAARAELTAVLAIPGELRAADRGRALAALAEALRRAGDSAGAVTALSERVELGAGDAAFHFEERAEAMLALADLLRARGGADGAAAASWERRAAELLLAGPVPEPAPPELALDPAYPLRQAEPAILAAYEASFQSGITELQAGRRAEAIARFEDCLRLLPGVPICSYNVACARALDGDADGAFAALERAVADGFGFRDSDLRLLESDADLAALRADARYRALVAEVAAARASAQRDAEEPLFFVPDSAGGTGRRPLLIVLHAHGASKDAVVEGPWRAVAEASGMILAAPSGPYRAAGSGAGPGARTWMEDVARYRTSSWRDDRPALDAFLAARRRFRIDPARVVLAGEGLGGVVAFNVALRAPGSFRGVLLHHAPVDLELARERAEPLRALAPRLVLVPEAGLPVEGLLRRTESAAHAGALAEACRALGVDAAIVEADGRDVEARLAAALDLLLRP